MSRIQPQGNQDQDRILTELEWDAFCFNWGFYGSLLTAGYIIATDKLNGHIVCRPCTAEISGKINNHSKSFKPIEEFIKHYCLVTNDVTIYNETAPGMESTFTTGIQDPRQIIDWLPRILVIFAGLHLIPKIYWEQTVGKILKNYLSHMANLITIIKEKCGKIPVNATWGGISIPKAGIFDEDSRTFDSDSPYEQLTMDNHFVSGQNEPQKKSDLSIRALQTKSFQKKYKERMKKELTRRQSTVKSQKKWSRQLHNNSEFQQRSRENSFGKRENLDYKISKMNDKDLRMKLDNEFSDRHLFSQLCHHNFAHLPEITFIESVQRVVSPGIRVDDGPRFDPIFHTKLDGRRLNAQYEPREMEDQEIFGLDEMEKGAASYDMKKNMGVLWTITKMFTCTRNFSGKKLLRIYKRRLWLTMGISLVPLMTLLIWRITCNFRTITKVVRCIDETDSHFKCLLPAAGNVISLCWLYISLIQAPIFFISIYQFFKIEPAIANYFNIQYEPHRSRGSTFVQKVIDDPLSYSTLWSEERYKTHMTRATSLESTPIIIVKKI